MGFFKVRHKETGLFWKGGGMNINNKSSHTLWSKNHPDNGKALDYKSKSHALAVCFSKTGKVYSRKNHVTTAISFGHESGLNRLIAEDCEIIEIPERQYTIQDIEKIFEAGLDAARLYWGEGMTDINFDEVFKKALEGKYFPPTES